MNVSTIKHWLVSLCLLALVACGGGGGGDAGTPVLPGTGSGNSGGGTGGGTTASATVSVALSSATVTAASPATVTVTVRDAAGLPIAGKVVDLKTVRGTLASLNLASVATGSDGSARAQLSALPTGVSGADEVVAVAALGTTTVQGSAGFTVAGSAPTIGLTISMPTLRSSSGAATLRAEVKDAAGALVKDAVVSFTARSGLVNLSAPSVVTDGFGVATVNATVASASVTAAEILTASATVAGASVQSTVVVQLVADSPSIAATVSNSAVSAAAPATLSVLVKDAAGAVVKDAVVSWTSSFGLVAFDAGTSATDLNGVARVTITPKLATSNGADQVVAGVTVGGVALTTQAIVQVIASTSSSPPVLQLAPLPAVVSSATPATVTATLTDGKGAAVAGQVITFKVARGLGVTNIGTALTDSNGNAVVVLSPASAVVAGADEVTASASFGGVELQATRGFQIQATNVALTSFSSAVASLGAYGQTTMTLRIAGASVGSPVNISVSSSCVSQGKATLSPATFTTTNGSVDLQYKDNGCGAVQVSDQLQATIVGGTSTQALTLPITAPAASSLAFVSASPEIIYIKGSGFTEASTLVFEVRDGANNILPNRSVTLSLLTRSGGATIEGGTADVTQISDAAGRVNVRVNSGTLPTPLRVAASLTDTPAIATVSSNLSVAVGLPSQLNFSLSQQTRNVEGFDIDGSGIAAASCPDAVACNTYNLIASDRNGNPVPAGTSINFITEGGQVEAIKQTQFVGGIAQASARFASASPRPADGRITVTAYALGEESFIDQNGNNTYDAGEPFQDLGNLFKDRLFDGSYDLAVDEYVPTNIANSSGCVAPGAAAGATASTTALLSFDPSIPSVAGSTCDGRWSGAGKVYVRRAAETVLSTSAARPLWASKSGLDNTCSTLRLQTGAQPAMTASFTPVQGGETWYSQPNAASTTLSFIVGDANTFPVSQQNFAFGRLNPMAAGTVISATTPTTGLRLTVGGTPVPNTSEASLASVGVGFIEATSGVVFVTFTSPSKLATTFAINVVQTSGANPKPSNCP